MLTGALYIQNVAYTTRVVDLKDGKAGSPLIGYSKQNSKNQKWTFEADDEDANQYELSCTSTSGDAVTQYAKADAPKEGDEVDGSASSTVRTVAVHDNGKFRISVKDKDGNRIYWTLPNETAGTKIVLKLYNGGDNQYWTQASS